MRIYLRKPGRDECAEEDIQNIQKKAEATLQSNRGCSLSVDPEAIVKSLKIIVETADDLGDAEEEYLCTWSSLHANALLRFDIPFAAQAHAEQRPSGA
jgi:hypothetical protein